MQRLLRTPLYDWHHAASARISEFGGWEMPIQYTSVIQEHEAVRHDVGITDVSHMGRLLFSGSGAGSFLDSILTRDIASLRPGQIRYSLLTNPEGGILDDLLVGLVDQAETGETYYSVVVNASNREKDIAFIKRYLTPDIVEAANNEVVFRDATFDTGMIAVQGPKSLELLQPILQADLAAMKYYSGQETTFSMGGRWAFVSRTGYTGEDGFEITMEPFLMEQVVEQLFEAGQSLGVRAVGLAARDTLRLEMGMPLYGHELSEEITPREAGLDYAVYFGGPDFPGKKALLEMKDRPLKRTRIGLTLTGKRPAREGNEILHEGKTVGSITSGTFSPSLQKPIAMGYVPPELAEPGQTLEVDIRGKQEQAIVTALPFYRSPVK